MELCWRDELAERSLPRRPENVLHNRDRRGQRATHAKKPQPFEQTRGPVGSSWVLPCAVSISALALAFE